MITFTAVSQQQGQGNIRVQSSLEHDDLGHVVDRVRVVVAQTTLEVQSDPEILIFAVDALDQVQGPEHHAQGGVDDIDVGGFLIVCGDRVAGFIERVVIAVGVVVGVAPFRIDVGAAAAIDEDRSQARYDLAGGPVKGHATEGDPGQLDVVD